MKIDEQTVRKLIRNEAREMLREIASDRQVFNALDMLAAEIERQQDEDDDTSPYETIAVELVKYFDNEDVEEALTIIGSAYDFEYDFSEMGSEED